MNNNEVKVPNWVWAVGVTLVWVIVIAFIMAHSDPNDPTTYAPGPYCVSAGDC